MNIIQTIQTLKTNWQTPKYAQHKGVKTAFPLACTFYSGTPATAIPTSLPTDLREFWQISTQATLFKDVMYGQWGLEILTYSEALHITQEEKMERPDDYNSQDLVIGRFIGDAELLVISPNENGWQILVALPIDHRADWQVIAHSFAEFLEKYVAHEGDKYWE